MTTTVVRYEERGILGSMLASERPEFLAIYGRRRVGKTHLVRSYFEDREDVIFFDVTGSKNTSLSEQIANFTFRLGQVFYDGAKLAAESNWSKAFQSLTEAMAKQPATKKVVLFFDEFPWMATKNSLLIQKLDYYWNQYWSKDKRIKLIICGSSASWIINKIVNNKGGLHNRITRHIHLKPFNLAQMKKFLISLGVKLNNDQLLQIYMVTGGIPYYLMNIEGGKSAAQIIDQLAFKSKGLLLNEFDNLFSSLFDNYQIYVDIIRLIAQTRYGIAKEAIYKKIDPSIKGKKGIHILQALEDAGFVMSFKSHLNKKKGIYYRVIDEYTLFYLYWIEPVKESLLKQSFEKGYWQILHKQPKWQSWSGYAFEAICYKHIVQIKKALHLSPIDIPDTWRYAPRKGDPDRGAQIDLLFDRQDGVITLCEIKYRDTPFTIDKAYAENLMRKMTIFKQKTDSAKQLFMVLVAAHGVKNNFYAEELIVDTVTLDDLFLAVE